jgi:hypothetical protein
MKLPPLPYRVLSSLRRQALVLSALACNLSLFAITPSQIPNPIAAGSTIVIDDGVYDYSTLTRLVITSNGTSTQPVVLKAQTPGKVVFSGLAQFELAGSYLTLSGFRFDRVQIPRSLDTIHWPFVISGDHVRVTQCAFIACTIPDTYFNAFIGVSHGATFSRIDHCYFQDNLGATSVAYRHDTGTDDDGRVIASGQNHQFDRNYFYASDRLRANGGSVVSVGNKQPVWGQRSTALVLENTLIEKWVTDPEPISNKDSNNIYRYNTFENLAVLDASVTTNIVQLSLRGGHDCIVENNYFLSTGGIVLFGGSHTVANNYLEDTQHYNGQRQGAISTKSGSGLRASVPEAVHSLVVNNTMVNVIPYAGSSQPMAGIMTNVGSNIFGPATGHFANNVVQSDAGNLVLDYLVYADPNRVTNSTFANNYVWNSGSASYGLSNAGLVAQNPGLVDDGMVYRLGTSSAARDPALSLTDVPTDDIEGQTRDSTPDLGADEYVSGTAPRRQLLPADVGPVWMGGPTTGLDTMPPVRPDTLAGTALGPTQIYLTWSDKAPDETGYQIRYRDVDSYWKTLPGILAANSTAKLLSGLTPNTSYEVQVRATGTNGASAYADKVLVTTPAYYLESSGSVTVEAEHFNTSGAGTALPPMPRAARRRPALLAAICKLVLRESHRSGPMLPN